MADFKVERQKLLRIFIGESDRVEGSPLYLAIIELCREKGIRGATVLRGIAGYGLHNTLHTDRILRLSGDLPLVVEVVDSEEKIRGILSDIQEIAGGGIITVESIEVVSL